MVDFDGVADHGRDLLVVFILSICVLFVHLCLEIIDKGSLIAFYFISFHFIDEQSVY